MNKFSFKQLVTNYNLNLSTMFQIKIVKSLSSYLHIKFFNKF